MPSWGLYPRELYTNKLKNPRERPIDKGRYAEMSDIMRNESFFLASTIHKVTIPIDSIYLLREGRTE